MSVTTAKQQLRAEVLAARSRMSVADRGAAGKSIAALGEREWSGASSVAAYLAVGSEPPTEPLLALLLVAGVRVLLPVITGDTLDWAWYDGPTAVSSGPLGINEPAARRLGADALSTVDIVIVPALAADRQGNRLGRGRGYYDRALAAVTAPLIAVGFDSELVDHVPTEPHDRAVDAVLRPCGLTTCG